MFRGDAAHSGTYAGQAPRQFHRVKWKFPTGDRVVSSPVCQDKVLYFGGDDGNIYAVDAETGRQIWKRATGGPVPSTPAVANGTVYAGSYDGKFYALNAQTGAIRWKFATGGERRFEAKGIHGLEPKNQTIADQYDVFLSSPVIVQGAVYFGSGDGNLYALDAASGELKWKFKTGDVVHASPAYADGVLYFGSWDSFFYAVDAATGKEKWRFHGGEDPLIHNQVGFQSSAAVVDGVVYVGCRDSNLYALEAATGQEKWRFNNEMSWVISSPAVAQGKVFFATSDSSLYHVVDAATGKSVLRAAGQGLHVFLSLGGRRRGLDRRAQRHPRGARPEKRRGALGFPDGGFEAKQRLGADRRPEIQRARCSITRTGARRPWWRPTASSVSARSFRHPWSVNGVVYFGSTDGNLYALE